MKSQTFLAFTMMLTLLVGCEVPELEIPMTEAKRQGKQQLEEDQKARSEAGIDEKTPAATDSEGPSASTTEATTTPAEPKEFTVQDAKKGKKSRQAGGYLGAVGNARFSAEHKMILINMEKALNFYNAEKGYYPKTQEEFDEKIIKANGIKLPELEADEEYVYDPEEPLKLKFRKKQN